MKYDEIVVMKNGEEAHLRNAVESDGAAVVQNFNLTHEETDFLLTYPEENSMDAKQEGEFLQKKADSDNEIEIIALVDGKVAGTAGIDAIGTKYKLKHRAEFGISVAREYWGLGLGTALTNACIKCAKEAGYEQLELDAVADNKQAISLYEKAGFVEFGRNPKGFKSKFSGYQELVYMRLEL